jgi:hypothetical protein
LETNGLAPVAVRGGRFSLVYALSIHHLQEALQSAWMDEVPVMLRPGGASHLHDARLPVCGQTSPTEQGGSRVEAVLRRRPAWQQRAVRTPDLRANSWRSVLLSSISSARASGNPWQDLWLVRKDLGDERELRQPMMALVSVHRRVIGKHAGADPHVCSRFGSAGAAQREAVERRRHRRLRHPHLQ